LVLLKVNQDEPLEAIQWYLDKPATVGQYAIAVGRMGDAETPAIAVGIISARDRLWGKALQTDARISPAFYVGPLSDILGNVLGIVVPAVPEQGGAEEKTGWYDAGIGFAIDSASIAPRLERMRAGKDIQKGLLGIVSADSDPYSAGTLVEAVRPRSPAEKAGLKGGDEIVSVAGTPVRHYYEIRQLLGRFDAGDALPLTVHRDGQTLDITAQLASEIPPFDPQRLGIYAASREDRLVVTAVVPDSPAAAELRPGDQIVQVAERPVPTAAALRRRVMSHDPEMPLKMTIQRDGQDQTLEISTQSVAGPLGEVAPPSLAAEKEDAETAPAIAWKETNLTLPDVPNKAIAFAPADPATAKVRGLLVVMADPGDAPDKQPLDRWREAAKSLQVAVAIVFAADNERWTPPESDVAGQIAAKLSQQWNLDRAAVGVTGETAGASFAMAMVVAITQQESISGVFASPEMRPPAIRLSENDPALPSQVALPLPAETDPPGWAAVLPRIGYPIVRAPDANPETVVRWVISLTRI
jgi:S1-C subfamily serine protease